MRWIYALIFSLTLQSAWAQQGPPAQQSPGAAQPAHAPQPLPSPEELNPAVDTSPAPAAPAAPSSAPSPSPSEAHPGAAAPAAADTGAPDAKRQGKPAAKGARGASPDRVELETTDITGNRELPKVLYIVPWKRSDLGDLVGKPPNSLLDEVLEPIDRDVFLRQNRYYDALQAPRARGQADSVQGSGDKPSP